MFLSTRFLLNPDLFLGRNAPGAVLYPRRHKEEFVRAFFRVWPEEISLLKLMDGSRPLQQALQTWGRCQLGVELPPEALGAAENNPVVFSNDQVACEIKSIQRFVQWAIRQSILLPVAGDSGARPIDSQFDARLFLPDNPPAGFDRGRRSGNRTEYPLYFTFVTTFECMVQCAYCYLGHKQTSNNPIPFERLKEILDECKALPIFQIRLSGGEVLLYKHLFPLLHEIFDRGMYLGQPISTKIPVSPRTLGRLKEAGITQLQYSLDSVDSKVLASLIYLRNGTNYAAYIHAMLESIKNAARLGFQVIFRPTLTREVYVHVDELIRRVADIEGVRIILGPVVSDGVNVSHQRALSKDDWRRTQDLVDKIRGAYPQLSIEFKARANLADIAADDNVNIIRFATTKEFTQACACSGNRVMFCMLPDGRTTFCATLHPHETFVLGDLNYQSITDMWSSENALRLAYPERYQMTGSACQGCDDFERCHLYAGKCYALIANAYGAQNHHFPDPRCPKAPRP